MVYYPINNEDDWINFTNDPLNSGDVMYLTDRKISKEIFRKSC